jgi:hypothetical protein
MKEADPRILGSALWGHKGREVKSLLPCLNSVEEDNFIPELGVEGHIRKADKPRCEC